MTQPAPFQNLTRRTEQERRTTADKFAQSYAQRGTPMGREKQPETTKTTPVPPAPAGTVRGVFGNVKPVSKIPPIPDIGFGDNPKLDDHFGKDAPDDVEPLFDATASQSPDVAGSPTPAPATDAKLVEAVTPAKSDEPPHWSEIKEQRDLFCSFVMSQIEDFGLMDKDEHGTWMDWTCAAYTIKHGFVPADYPTLTMARTEIAETLLNDFKADLKAIMMEKNYPIERDTLKKMIGHDSVKDALQKMTGKGIRTAICSHLAAWEQAQHIEQTNANMQKHLAEQAKPEPTAPDVVIEAVHPEPKTVEQRALTVQRNRVPSAPPEHSLSVNWQMNPLEIATFAVQSGLYKGIDSTAKAMMVMLRGLSLQIDPLMALEQINIIEGKTAVSSALMHALVERSGHLEDIKIVETDTQCTVTLFRTGRSPVSATYATDDAIKAGLINKYNWKSMPKLMRYHRAFAIAARRAFSDVLLFGGAIYTNEELQPDRNVNEDGDFVAVA